MRFVHARRVRREAALLRDANIYRDSQNGIVSDYATRKTHRGIMQVVNLESVLRYAETADLQGAFVETGTYTGGASAYTLRALQRLRLGKTRREYWGFDSFEGMPTPSVHDGDESSLWMYGKSMNDAQIGTKAALVGHEVNRADYDECLALLRGTGYPTDRLHLVKGWFQNTLAPAKPEIGPIAILRMDGDFYESTKVVFEALYDQVVPGGAIIIDDYGAISGCRRAAEEFFAQRGINPHLIYVENSIRYFVKPDDSKR